MDLLNNAFVLANNTRQTELLRYDRDFFQRILHSGRISLAITVLCFFLVIGFGIFISIKYFRMTDVAEFGKVDLKNRRIVMVFHVYFWSVVLGIFVLVFRDSSILFNLFPRRNSLTEFLDLPALLLYFPMFAKFHFIFFLNLHYVYVRYKRYSNWKVNYCLENYRHYLVLAFVTAFIWITSIAFTNKETGYLIFMSIYIVIMLILFGVNIEASEEPEEINRCARQAETRLKVVTQAIHFVSLIIAISAIGFYSVDQIEINFRLCFIIAIFVEPALLTISQYLIYRAKLQDTSARVSTQC